MKSFHSFVRWCFAPALSAALCSVHIGAAESPSPNSRDSERPAAPVTVRAPLDKVEVRVFVNDDGRLSYSIERLAPQRTPLLAPSPLGITVDGVDLGKGVTIDRFVLKSHQDEYPWYGVHSVATNHYREANIQVHHAASGTDYTLELRVFDDGVGYRYAVPGKGERTISGEASGWTLPPNCQIWYQTNLANYEGFYAKAAPASLRPEVPMGFPVTVVYADGSYGAITEAGLFAYSGLSVRSTGSDLLKGVFEDNSSWKVSGEIQSPWRVTLTGPELNALVNADVVHNLCPPPDPELFPDGLKTSWIKPGCSLWNWWSDSSVAFPDQKQWIDAAAAMGMKYYLVDAGWERRWTQADRDKWSFLKELCDYARGKGVGINVWKHWSGLQDPAVRRDFLHQCASAGAAGVKIDFMDSESRQRIQFYTDTLKDAAREHLLINFHGANKPTGEARTYPNELTREGIRGLEYNKWSALPPEHYATLPFTRFLAGHGDFTPCTFNPDRLKGTTAALQLASAITTTSPLLHWADYWKRYEESAAREVVTEIPSTWDETRVLPGSKIGELAAMARRKGEDWFVAVVNGGDARTYALNLDFLDQKPYQATFVRDAEGAPGKLTVEHAPANRQQKLEVKLAAGGGFVAVLKLNARPLSKSGANVSE